MFPETYKPTKGAKMKKETTTTRANKGKHIKGKIVIIRPNTGDYTKGYDIALQDRNHLTLIGELQLLDLVNATDKQKETYTREGKLLKALSKLEKAAVKSLDFPHVLATAAALCGELNLEPCNAIRLFGAGAAKTCRPYDDARAKMSELKGAQTKAAAALLDAIRNGKKSIKKEQDAYSTANKEIDAFAPVYDGIVKEYKAAARNAVALLAMVDLRK